MHEGEVDGVVLALAGLQRLGVENIITTVLNITQMIPAASQGALAIECRAHDPRTQEILHLIHDVRTHICTTIERSFLHVLDGSCRKPIGGYAFFTNDILHFQGFMASETGERFSKIHAFPLAHESPQDFGRRAGFELLERFHHS
jgi:hydroxymethylbilane synthase